MPLNNQQKKLLCCLVFEPPALTYALGDFCSLAETVVDVTKNAVEKADERELEEALALCAVFNEQTAEIRGAIAKHTDIARQALMALGSTDRPATE